MTTVPRLWPSSTIVCLGSGPSLTQADVDFVRDKARVIAINDGYRIAPWADVWYACDQKFWKWQARDHRAALDAFTGPRFTLMRESTRWAAVQVLKNTGEDGLETHPSGLRTGRNGGYQAINLAVHLGATRIVLLGYDMCIGPHGQQHWFGSHPEGGRSPYAAFVRLFPTMIPALKTLGVEVVNCSRRTALHCFPKADLRQVLTQREVAA